MIDLILGAICEVRSEAHQAAHGGLTADSAWHIRRGELPTCRPKEGSGTQSQRDNSSRDDWGRDSWGFGCSWRGCG